MLIELVLLRLFEEQISKVWQIPPRIPYVTLQNRCNQKNKLNKMNVIKNTKLVHTAVHRQPGLKDLWTPVTKSEDHGNRNLQQTDHQL